MLYAFFFGCTFFFHFFSFVYCFSIFFFFFFFSSRRRHTRSLRDWSSDVCSSDLTIPAWTFTPARAPPTVSPPIDSPTSLTSKDRAWPSTQPVPRRWLQCISPRSEERRVGKECRSRWSP